MTAFKCLLDPSEARLGSKIVYIHWFYKGSVQIVFLKKIRLGIASWMDLGVDFGPKRVPKGCQIGSRMEQKWHRKTIKK